MIVAAIAWGQLKPEVRREAARLLKENPHYSSWTDGVDNLDRDAIAFILASTWPDEIKSDRNYDNSEGEHPKFGAKSGQNIGYADLLQHRYWHFYDTPFSPDGTKLGQPDPVNALTQIILFSNAIRDSTDDSIRSYDLVWLIHLVGDVHQPLHATSRFDAGDPNGDEGGNRVHLCTAAQMKRGDPKKCRSELHGFWDDIPGPNNGPEAARSKAAKLDPADTTAAGDGDPQDWIKESFMAAQKWAYTDPIQVGDGPFVLTTDYRHNAGDIVRDRLALAGARLANLLNERLATSH
jgi:hypothetical protein